MGRGEGKQRAASAQLRHHGSATTLQTVFNDLAPQIGEAGYAAILEGHLSREAGASLGYLADSIMGRRLGPAATANALMRILPELSEDTSELREALAPVVAAWVAERGPEVFRRLDAHGYSGERADLATLAESAMSGDQRWFQAELSARMIEAEQRLERSRGVGDLERLRSRLASVSRSALESDSDAYGPIEPDETTRSIVSLLEATAATLEDPEAIAVNQAMLSSNTLDRHRQAVSDFLGRSPDSDTPVVALASAAWLSEIGYADSYEASALHLPGGIGILTGPKAGRDMVALGDQGQLDVTTLHELIHSAQPPAYRRDDFSHLIREGATESAAQRIAAQAGRSPRDLHDLGYQNFTAIIDALAEESPDGDRFVANLAVARPEDYLDQISETVVPQADPDTKSRLREALLLLAQPMEDLPPEQSYAFVRQMTREALDFVR